MRTWSIVCITAGLSLASKSFCHAQSRDHIVQLKDFVDSGGVNDAAGTTLSRPGVKATFSLDFPRFDVYSSSGELIFHTNDLDQVRRFLDHFPRSADHLVPIAGTDNWSSIASKYHLEGAAQASGAQGHYTFLSLMLDQCNPCSIERDILTRASDKLSKQGVHQEILVLAR
jgi:hypothetical protein